jgi:SAM-dependent methyltransferase
MRTLAARLRRLLDALGLVALADDVRARLRYFADRETRARNARFARSLGPDEPPLPPPRLVYAVGGHFDLEEYCESGEVHADLIRDVLAQNERDIERCQSVLDFGCGCGRVLRQWRGIPGIELHGCDRDERLVAWCRRSLDFAEFRVNHLEPPLPYAGGQFDFVYAISVFTHLTEELQHAWMAELERVLAPGGVLLITTKGHSRIGPLDDAERARFEDGELVVRSPRYAGRNLCAAYHPERYVRERLAVGLRVLDFRPAQNGAAPSMDVFAQSQDVFLLQTAGSEPARGASR